MNDTFASDKLIGSLAILRSNLTEKDFISSYIPFVATVLLEDWENYGEQHGEKVVQLDRILEAFEKRFGFTINREPMTVILNKCVKKGLVERKRNATYVINRKVCEEYAISESALRHAKSDYKKVIRDLKNFYAQEFGIEDISEEEAEKNFLLFLDSNSAKTLILSLQYTEDDLHSPKQHSYIISRFIKHCMEYNPESFDKIQNLALSYLMSSAIAYGDKDETSQIDSYRNLVVYLDTPVLLHCLGLNDPSMKKADLALLEQIRNLSGLIRVFQHTYDETLGIITDCLKWIENMDYSDYLANNALREFVKRSYTREQVQEFIDLMPETLKKLGIEVDNTDYYAGRFYSKQEDEVWIRKSIISEYKKRNPSFRHWEKEVTIDYDVKSISAIFKLWSGKKATTYRQARFILLTTNSALAYITRQYTKKQNQNAIYKVYPCVTITFLGTNIWLSAPIHKIMDFSSKKLMADCMCVIEPSEKIIRRVREEIERARNEGDITESQYYLLKTKAFENDFLMNRTLSDETCFTDEIREELLQRITDELTLPYKESIEQMGAELQEVRSQKKQMEFIENERKKRENEERKREEEREAELKDKAEKSVDIIMNVIVGIGVLAVASFLFDVISLFHAPMWFKVTRIVFSLLVALIRIGYSLDILGLRTAMTGRYWEHLKVREYRIGLKVAKKPTDNQGLDKVAATMIETEESCESE